MAETKIYTYKNRINRAKIWQRIKEKMHLSKTDILVRLAGFFPAMAMPLPGIAPFGIAYLAQERRLSLKALISFLAVSVGSIAVCGRLGAVKYIGAGLIYLCSLFILKKGVAMTDVTAGIVAGASVFATGLATLILEGFSAIGFVLLLCEAALVVSGTLMMEKSVQAIKNRECLPKNFDSDTKLSLGGVILVALLGFKEVYLGTGFSVMNCIAATMLLTLSASGGAGFSTGAGVVLGIVCGIGGDFFMPILGAFSFCGFLSGVFSKFGKGGTIAGIILANGVMAVYTNNAVESVLNLWEILAAAVAFAFIPKLWLDKLHEVVCLDKADRENIAKVKANLTARLKSVASAFESIAKTMEHFPDKDNIHNDGDVAALFDATADKVCSRCRKSTVCWGQNFNTTYGDLFFLLEIMREKGVVKAEDANGHFASSCINLSGFLDELNHQFDIFRVRQVWKSKLCESRRLLGKQLGGVSQILDGLTDEIDGETKKIAISGWELRSRLEMSGIKPHDLNIMQDRYGRCRVEVVIKENKCHGKDRRTMEKIMKSCAGCGNMVREETTDNKKFVRLVFTEAQRFEVETDHASLAAEGKNGDNFRFLNLKNGKFIIAISDGMGTGSRAAKESEAMLELLDSFLQAGFDCRIAVRLINSIMIMKSEDSAFVTLDLCIIDLYTGEVKFIKTGAEPSFILGNSGRVRTVKAASLPVGLIAEAEAEVSDTKIQDGDRIVMITDGIENREDGSLWVGEFMKNNKDMCEGSLAKEILTRATQKQGGAVKDDMTVLSVKLKAVG